MDRTGVYLICDIKGDAKCMVVAEENSVYHVELMRSDYVKLCFKLYDKKSFGLGDYIRLLINGGIQKFEITEIQKPTYNSETGEYIYELQFNAEYYKWGNKKYKYEPKNDRFEATWTLTDTLTHHLDVLIRNLDYYGWKFTYNIFDVATANKSIYIQFDNISILDALNKIAEAFGTEWAVSDNIITLGREDFGSAITLEQDVNVENIRASDSSQPYITTLYAFGSTNNLPSNYRKSDSQVLLNGVVQKRLMLPKEFPFVKIDDVGSIEESVEGVVTFDDVYPKMDNSVTEVNAIEKIINTTDTIEADAGTTIETSDETSSTAKVNIYRIKDSSLSFKKEYILGGVTLQAVFSTGKLAGMVFDLAFNPDGEPETLETTTADGTKTTSTNADSQWFELVRNNTYGVDLPNDTLNPAVGDKFVLIGWDATKMDKLVLIENAETELLNRTRDYAKNLQIDPSTYTCTMMADYMYGLDATGKQDENYSMVGKFPIGQRVLLKSETFLKNGQRESRVIGFEYKLDFPYDSAQIIVGENSTYSYRKKLEDSINAKFSSINFRGSNYSNNENGGSNLYVITTTDVATPSDRNVLSALRTEIDFVHKRKDDNISALWTFNDGHGATRGVRSHEYEYVNNDGNLFGKGFELVEKTNPDGTVRSRLEVDELLVRIKAYFASLEIREISYVGGNFLFSSAGGKIYYVEWLNSAGEVLDKADHEVTDAYTFRCYLFSDNGTTATMNYFKTDDQIICQTFNIDEGVHENASNKFWWRRATGIGKGKIADIDDDTEYQYVDISMNDRADNSDYPEADDTIVQLGNWSDSKRQGAIYLIAEGELAPGILEYTNIGSDGNHFVFTKPTLQLSPKGNIIYGEFHSVADGSSTSDGGSIDDQINDLIKQLEEVRSQADKKFDIYFEDYAPHPLKGEDFSTANYPASEWNTDTLKALHVQDLFYDTDVAPASDGGRAWRWIRETATIDDTTTTTYYWEVVTDQDTIDALEKVRDLQNQVNDIVSDGIISRGSEKSELLIEWNKAMSNYDKYKEQADDYSLLNENDWTTYSDAFFAVAKMLNNGDIYTEDDRNRIVTPSWLDVTADTDLSKTPTLNAATYRNTWEAYYKAFAALLKMISAKVKELTDNAQSTADEQKNRIDDIVSDEKLDAAEKISIKKEFLSLWREIVDEGGLFDKGHDDSNNFYSPAISNACQDMTGAFNNLGKYLNGDAEWSIFGSDGRFIGVSERDVPLWISSDETSGIAVTQPITAETYRTMWSNYYSARAAYIATLSKNAQATADDAQKSADEKVQTFVTEAVPTPPYKKGDMWIQVGNGNNVMICLVDRDSGSGVLDEWTDLSDLTYKHDPRVQLAALGDKIYDLSGGYIQSRGSITISFFTSQPSTASEGDLWFNGTKLRRYVSSWAEITTDSYVRAFRTVFDIIGKRKLVCYSSVQTTADLYDLVLRTITWHDRFKNEDVEGNVEVLMYNGSEWETLKECTRVLMDNLGDELRLVVFGSDGTGAQDSSGLITKTMFNELFSQKITFDNNGNVENISKSGLVTTSDFASLFSEQLAGDGTVVKKAEMSAYVTKTDNGDGTYSLESDILLSADKIMFTGKTIINNKFWVDTDGNVHMADADVSGTITATNGKIAGFNIMGNGLVNEGFNNDAYIVFRNDYNHTFAGIGGNVLPDTSNLRAVARFSNEDTTNQWEDIYSRNIAMLLSAKNGTYNYAFIGTGNGVLNGDIFGYAFQKITCVANVIKDIDISKGTKILFTNNVSNGGLAMPKLSNLRDSICDNTSSFAIILHIIQGYGGTTGDVVYGKNSTVFSNVTPSGSGSTYTIINSDGTKSTLNVNSDGTITVITGTSTSTMPAGTTFKNYWMNTSEYPQIWDNDKGDVNSISMGSGDCICLMLVYNDGVYGAYMINKNWAI